MPDLTDGTDPKRLFKLWTSYRFSQGMLAGTTLGGGMLVPKAGSRAVLSRVVMRSSTRRWGTASTVISTRLWR
ncbi:MAG: hypothetical protein CBCREVIR_2121 [Candidatus Burkholderia crenata]|nr:MAG: hypothetical protein CBCREVIR_2121 [Candidatus Burkholderia crenata]